MATFHPKWSGAAPLRLEPGALSALDISMFRAVAGVLRARGITYVLVNPPDVAVQLEPEDTVGRFYWQPLVQALSGESNIVFVDLSHMPVEPGRDMFDHVARTYYGNRKEAGALAPQLRLLLAKAR